MSYDYLPPGTANSRLIDAMVASSKKSVLTAYLLWYFGGCLGLHNFYVGKSVLGALQAGSLPFCLVLLAIAKRLDAETIGGQAFGFLGIAVLVALPLSLLFDAFLIPSRIRAHSERLREHLESVADWRAA